MGKPPQVPRILILEANDQRRNRVCDLLEGQGWDVISATRSKEALDQLDQTKATPFHLFISSFKLPKMEGDDILKSARRISPLTQRMLMVPSNQTGLVIRAINKAEINACIINPSTDKDLIRQVRSCLKRFRQDMKHEQLKRVTAHQNRQMFRIAQKLKKKNTTCQEQIRDKKAEKRRLLSQLSAAQNRTPPDASLDARIRDHDIPLLPDPLLNEFDKLAGYIQALFNRVAAKAGLDPPAGSPAQIITQIMNQHSRIPPGPDQHAGSENSQMPNSPIPEVSETQERFDDLIRGILAVTYASPLVSGSPEVPEALTAQTSLDTCLTVAISHDLTRAEVMQAVPITTPDLLTLDSLLDLLRQKEIHYGIIDDTAINAWINDTGENRPPLAVAMGEPPVPGRDGAVTYHFQTDYSNPGKIKDDGSIDFRDRGHIPYVHKGDLLATKTPAREGRTGMAVTGRVIPVDSPFDPVFLAGSGTALSEDALSIHAALDGQPHLDACGEISVNPDLTIAGDIDFQTGNIEFNGNILVKGTIKEGFKVKGISLIAKEIEGADIELSGDLHVSDGITDTRIRTQGSIYAKFINNCRISSFGNLVISREIIDATILLSGACENPSGVIMASQVTAKAGIEAGKIGTPTSKPAVLKVGVSHHAEAETQKIDTRIQALVDELKALRDAFKSIEEADQNLYARITERAQAQEAAQNRIASERTQLDRFKGQNDSQGVLRARARLKELTREADAAEQELNDIFAIQDQYARQMDSLKSQIDGIEEANKRLVLRKKGIREFADRTQAKPEVLVRKFIAQDTAVQGPNTAITLRDDRRACRIVETAEQEDGLYFYDMMILDP